MEFFSAYKDSFQLEKPLPPDMGAFLVYCLLFIVYCLFNAIKAAKARVAGLPCRSKLEAH